MAFVAFVIGLAKVISLVLENGKAHIEPTLCYGCGLCQQVCPFGAIGGAQND